MISYMRLKLALGRCQGNLPWQSGTGQASFGHRGFHFSIKKPPGIEVSGGFPKVIFLMPWGSLGIPDPWTIHEHLQDKSTNNEKQLHFFRKLGVQNQTDAAQENYGMGFAATYQHLTGFSQVLLWFSGGSQVPEA